MPLSASARQRVTCGAATLEPFMATTLPLRVPEESTPNCASESSLAAIRSGARRARGLRIPGPWTNSSAAERRAIPAVDETLRRQAGADPLQCH